MISMINNNMHTKIQRTEINRIVPEELLALPDN